MSCDHLIQARPGRSQVRRLGVPVLSTIISLRRGPSDVQNYIVAHHHSVSDPAMVTGSKIGTPVQSESRSAAGARGRASDCRSRMAGLSSLVLFAQVCSDREGRYSKGPDRV
jgi:hypothetical protein